MLLNGNPGGFVFFEADYQKKELSFSWGDVTSNYTLELHYYSMVVILLSFLCNYDNLIVKLRQEKRSYLMKDGFLLTDSKSEVWQ